MGRGAKQRAATVARMPWLREVMLPLLHFEFDVAVQKYLDSGRDDDEDTAHLVPDFQSGLLRHLLRNIRVGGCVPWRGRVRGSTLAKPA